MEWYSVAIPAFGGLLLLLILGIPVAYSLLTVALVGLVFLGKGVSLLGELPSLLFGHMNSFTMTCVPLFIFMALIIEEAGFTRQMFDAVKTWLSRLPGSLTIIGIVACTVVAAVNGSSAATAASVGAIAMPEFQRAGCNKKLSVGAIAAGGSLGILIPPSMAMIFYCIVTESSIGSMFSAGIIPGVMTASFFIIYVLIRCKLNPDLEPLNSTLYTWKDRWSSLLGVIPILITILLVLGTIYAGIATPTEAAAVGCIGVIILGFAIRQLDIQGLGKALLKGVRVNGFLLLIVMGAIIFGAVLERAEVPSGFVKTVTGFELSKWQVLLVINIVYFILGMFMDPTPIILTTIPTLFPLSQALGFDPIWFGIITVMNLELAAITPPVGFNLFVLRGMASDYVTTEEIVLGAAPYGLIYVSSLILVIICPSLALYLPRFLIS